MLGLYMPGPLQAVLGRGRARARGEARHEPLRRARAPQPPGDSVGERARLSRSRSFRETVIEARPRRAGASSRSSACRRARERRGCSPCSPTTSAASWARPAPVVDERLSGADPGLPRGCTLRARDRRAVRRRAAGPSRAQAGAPPSAGPRRPAACRQASSIARRIAFSRIDGRRGARGRGRARCTPGIIEPGHFRFQATARRSCTSRSCSATSTAASSALLETLGPRPRRAGRRVDRGRHA